MINYFGRKNSYQKKILEQKNKRNEQLTNSQNKTIYLYNEKG